MSEACAAACSSLRIMLSEFDLAYTLQEWHKVV